MKIPPNAIIADEKLTRYLLVPRVKDDKSKFLAQGGFTAENPDALLSAIRQLVAENEAVIDRENIYGRFYEVEGMLRAVSGQGLGVVTIWLEQAADGVFKFVTLKPSRRS